MGQIVTDRVLLRQWRAQDRAPFAAMNADPDVMRFFPKPASRAESDQLVDRILDHFEEHGFGLWAAECRSSGAFMGFVGFMVLRTEMPFAPGVEIGWRLAKEFWGQGLAPEAARAALAYGFARHGFDKVCSFTAVQNQPSIRVMEKIGMTRVDGGDFDHPLLEQVSPLRRHVLYEIEASGFGAA